MIATAAISEMNAEANQAYFDPKWPLKYLGRNASQMLPPYKETHCEVHLLKFYDPPVV